MSYIGYIPKPIRHSVDLSPRDKLIYCEITANLDDRGVCIKNNIYFSNVTGCTKATVSASMTKLRELDYIDVIIEKEENTQKFKKRYIILKAVSNLQGGVRHFSTYVTLGGYAKKPQTHVKYRLTPLYTIKDIYKKPYQIHKVG